MTHLEKDFESPIWRHLNRDLAKDNSFIRYDARGNGLSDWDADDISFDAFIRDLEVVDAAGIERFALFGISRGALSRWPTQRVIRSVSPIWCSCGYAQGWSKRARTEAEKQQSGGHVDADAFG